MSMSGNAGKWVCVSLLEIVKKAWILAAFFLSLRGNVISWFSALKVIVSDAGSSFADRICGRPVEAWGESFGT